MKIAKMIKLVVFLVSYITINSSLAINNDIILEIQNGLNGIKTMSASIIQIDSTSDNAKGTFYLKKPNKMRIDYNSKKNHISMLATKQLVTYYDHELDELSHVPTSSTPAMLLMDDNINFDKFEVLETTEQNDLYTILFHYKDNKEDGIFAFSFVKKNDNFVIQRIDKYNDAQKLSKLSILFSNVKINEKIEDKIFVFKDKRLSNI